MTTPKDELRAAKLRFCKAQVKLLRTKLTRLKTEWASKADASSTARGLFSLVAQEAQRAAAARPDDKPLAGLPARLESELQDALDKIEDYSPTIKTTGDNEDEDNP